MGSADEESASRKRAGFFSLTLMPKPELGSYAVRGDSTSHFSSMFTSDSTMPPQNAAIKV
jgi:hypothetical protein